MNAVTMHTEAITDFSKLPKSQQRSIEQFRAFMQRQLNTNPEYGDTLTEFAVEMTGYGNLWLRAQTDMTKLGEGNLLRALDRQYWLVAVGKHGALTVKMCPKSFHQFNITRGARRKAFGMIFDTGR